MQATFQNPSDQLVLNIRNPFSAFDRLLVVYNCSAEIYSWTCRDIETYRRYFRSEYLVFFECQRCARELYKRIVQSDWVHQQSRAVEMKSLARNAVETMDGIMLAVGSKAHPDSFIDELINKKLIALLDRLRSMQARFFEFALEWDAFAASSNLNNGELAGPTATSKPKARKRGRPEASDPEKDQELVKHWKAAKEMGAAKRDFCERKGISVDDLKDAQDRERKRKTKAPNNS